MGGEPGNLGVEDGHPVGLDRVGGEQFLKAAHVAARSVAGQYRRSLGIEFGHDRIVKAPDCLLLLGDSDDRGDDREYRKDH